MLMKRFEDVRDGLDITILQMEERANDLKSLADVRLVIEDGLCFRLHDIVASLELSVKTS
jgi:hypothetical protein